MHASAHVLVYGSHYFSDTPSPQPNMFRIDFSVCFVQRVTLLETTFLAATATQMCFIDENSTRTASAWFHYGDYLVKCTQATVRKMKQSSSSVENWIFCFVQDQMAFVHRKWKVYECKEWHFDNR